MVTFPAVIPGDPLTISATTYVAFLQCEAKAVSRFHGIFGADSRSGLRGGLAHRIFARHLTMGAIDTNDFTQACREEIGAGGLNPKLGSLGIRPSELRSLISEVGDLYERFKRFPTEGFQGAEVCFEHQPAAGVTLKGSIDAVFEDGRHGVRLIDWKTGALGEAAPQLSFYALAWAMERGSPPGLVEAVSVLTGERFAEEPTPESLDSTAAVVARIVDVARTQFAAEGDPAKTAGPWCRYCPVLEGCAEGAAAAALSGTSVG